MLNRVIVGVDGRRGGREALRLGRHLCGAGRGTIVAVHVFPDSGLRPLALDAETEIRLRAERLLSDELSLAGVEAGARVTGDASPARGLQRVADRVRADVIVVGSSHRRPAGRALHGDTVRAVLAGARCPIAVAAAAGRRAMPDAPVIGVGVDGGPESLAALAWARDAAEVLGAGVHVLCAAEPPMAFTPGVSYGINWATIAPARAAYAERQLDAALDLLDPQATGEIAVGLARDELRRLSERVDLLVLGSRGFGPVRRTLLGSTSDHLVHEAACPVVVVPRPPAAARKRVARSDAVGVRVQ